LKNSNPYNIKPCQSAPGRSPETCTAARGKPIKGPNPFQRFDSTEIVLLEMQIFGEIVTKQGKEGSDCERFIAVADDAKIYPILIEPDIQKCHRRINGDHEKNADDVALLSRLAVMRRMGQN
jgi:hypothetical protein